MMPKPGISMRIEKKIDNLLLNLSIKAKWVK